MQISSLGIALAAGLASGLAVAGTEHAIVAATSQPAAISATKAPADPGTCKVLEDLIFTATSSGPLERLHERIGCPADVLVDRIVSKVRPAK